MKIEHLKNQFRSFTLASGKSLYLYPMAKEIEISEQDFYLSKKLQRYIKEEDSVAVMEEKSQVEMELKSKEVSLDNKSKKSKKKQKALEE